MIDCKIIDAKIGNLDLKVLVELHDQSWWNGKYKMTVKLSTFPTSEPHSIKGEYRLVRLAFDNFDTETANKMAEAAWKIANKEK